jgi:glycosyltransferase involved in cell wall biosynthesis
VNNSSSHFIEGLSVVVPVYNSAQILPRLRGRLIPILNTTERQYEIILVNDGSRDDSWSVIEKLADEDACIRGINMMRNYGQHNALLAGIRAARYNLIVTMDDDLQHPPEELPKLLATLTNSVDVVYGTPEKEPHGLWRAVASKLIKKSLQGVLGVSAARKVSAFRVFRTRLRDAFANYNSPYVSIDVLLTWGTVRYASVQVRHEMRVEGVSNYSIGRLINHAITLIAGFSVWPLKLASIIGFVFTGLGFAVLIYVVGRYLFEGESVAGFPFLASIIAIFAGAQMFALGIMGEYLARMHFRMMERPAYSIRNITQ